MVINKLNAATLKVLQLRDARQSMGNDGTEPEFNTAYVFTSHLQLITPGGPSSSKLIKGIGLRESP